MVVCVCGVGGAGGGGGVRVVCLGRESTGSCTHLYVGDRGESPLVGDHPHVDD